MKNKYYLPMSKEATNISIVLLSILTDYNMQKIFVKKAIIKNTILRDKYLTLNNSNT